MTAAAAVAGSCPDVKRSTRTRSAALLLAAAVACGDDATGPDQPSGPIVAQVAIDACYGIHDTYVRDGLAFVAAWNSGLQIYDVGAGMAGGSPAAPELVGEVVAGGTNSCSGGARTHNSWWFHNPVTGEARYLFVGQEGPGSIGTAASGDIYVIDVSDLSEPVLVGTYHLPNAGAHNFWVDEPNQILYAAYYNGGVVALDVSGTLPADLSEREIDRILPGGEGGTYTWGVMLHQGSLYAADMLSGLHQLRLDGTSLVHLAGGGNVEDRFTSDLWVHGGYAYTGTHSFRSEPGNTVYIWDLSVSGAPSLIDSLAIADVTTISDLEVSSDGSRLLVTTECGACAGAGLYIYELSDPRRPVRVGHHAVDTGLHTGTFANIGGVRYVFAARNPNDPALMIFRADALAP
jgi:hypothetical protein